MLEHLASFADNDLGAGNRAMHYLSSTLQSGSYQRDFAFALLAVASGHSGDSWAERVLALLFLENQLLRLAPDDLTEFDAVLVELGLKPEPGLEIPLRESILREGYSSRNLRQFVPELMRRLSRLNRIHQPILNSEIDPVSWGYFLRVARDLPKLTLARYVFSVDEVYREITRTLHVTDGVEDTLSRFGEQSAAHWARQPVIAPDLEIELLKKLSADRHIYWVSDRCGSELNSMVEYPLTSAVAVIKPPGSDFEIEIKRAGTKGPRLLNVITEKNGRDAPTSHRLFGGSLGWLAQRETEAAGVFSKIFRLVHGADAPSSRGVVNSSIVTVPAPEGPVHILDFLTGSECFGAGFEKTREAMKVCVQVFPSDTGVARASYGGEQGATLQFIGQALPTQAIIFGSSSFRLDRINLYLSEDGPEHYFRIGLGRDYTAQDLRWLADSVLEEILGEVTPPPEGFFDYTQYVKDAFRAPENRVRANANYLSVMCQIGKCWGTLLAVRGFSDGESFVLRNVGLKSIWTNGAWQIRIIFMDHDDLTVAGSRYRYLWPQREIAGMERDHIHILGGPMGDAILPGEVGALNNIYRVSPSVAESGLNALKDALCAAYDLTQSQLNENEELRGLFYPQFLIGCQDFDELVPLFLDSDPARIEFRKVEASAILSAKGYDTDLIAEYTSTLCNFRNYFSAMRFLYSR